jgi:hypothetical protein
MSRRSVLYRRARLLGDYQAVKRSRVGKRLARRYAGTVTGRDSGDSYRTAPRASQSGARRPKSPRTECPFWNGAARLRAAQNTGRRDRQRRAITGVLCRPAQAQKCRYGAPGGSHLPTFCAHVRYAHVQALIGSYGASPAFEETKARLAANTATAATDSA